MTTTLTPDLGDDGRRRLVGAGFAFLSHQGDVKPVSRIVELGDGTKVNLVDSDALAELLARSKADSRAPSFRAYLRRLAATPLLASLFALWTQLSGRSPEWLTGIAVFLAGQKRKKKLAEEWRAHLSGGPDRRLSPARQVRHALGFVWSAICYRRQAVADQAWRPADAVLGSRTMSNLFVGGPVIVVLFAIVHHDGRFGLVADIQDPAALGAFLYGVIRTGRWWRGVKPPEPKARRARD